MRIRRREFLEASLGSLPLLASCGGESPSAASPVPSPTPPPRGSTVFHVGAIPDQPFVTGPSHHAGVDAMLSLLGRSGLRLHRSARTGATSGPDGMIATDDVVLVKVNAQWKYRGCTNSDVVRGLVQRILEHPDGFAGEVVIVENGQGRGSLGCDTASNYDDAAVHANANDERHSFLWLVSEVFRGAPVSARLLDPIRSRFIADDDHATDGYRRLETVSYPCFTTALGRRVELREGVWDGTRHRQNLKLVNVPVLKTHGGSEMTGAVKHFYGLLSMSDGQSDRHYTGLGQACGRMIVQVRPPVLNLIDAVWVSHAALKGYPASATCRANQLVASQDPVAADCWAARNVLYPIDRNARHSPEHPNIVAWLESCMAYVNSQGGIFRPQDGIQIRELTRHEAEISVVSATA